MVASYTAGGMVCQLAAEFGVNRKTITRHLQARSIRIVNRLSEADTQIAIDLYAQGWSLARIGDRLGRDHTVIRDALVKAGIQRRDTHGLARS